MITITAQNGYNERYAPAGAKKAYVARIVGRDTKFTFEREFVAGHGSYDIDTPGLYEVRTTDKKGRADDEWRVVAEFEGETRSSVVSKEEAMKIAKALESRDIDAVTQLVWVEPEMIQEGKRKKVRAELITEKQAERAAVAHGIDSATAACWEIIRSFPERDAKKVLTALRLLASPPKAKAAAAHGALSEDTPVGIVADYAADYGDATMADLGQLGTPVIEEEEMATV